MKFFSSTWVPQESTLSLTTMMSKIVDKWDPLQNTYIPHQSQAILCKKMVVMKYKTALDAMTSCLKKTQQFFNHFQHLCVLKKIKKQEKQHEGRPLSNASLNFIQNGKYCNCCMRSFREVLAVEAETITCYRFCFIQKTLNGKVDTACPSNKAQIQQLPLSLWLACELTLDGSPVMTESVWTWASHP